MKKYSKQHMMNVSAMCRHFICAFLMGGFILLGGCAEVELGSHAWKSVPDGSAGSFKVGQPYQIRGTTYHPQEQYNMSETGVASWYGPGFHGAKTANGEVFNKNELTAAHRTLQMPSLVRVTNLDNGRSLIVRVNDRGPFEKGRVIDVSEKASELLGFKTAGTARVRLDVLTDESRRVAEAAKAGKDVRGVEVALNRQTSHPLLQNTANDANTQIAAIEQRPAGEPLAPPQGTVPGQQPAYRPPEEPKVAAVPGHFTDGVFYPDPVVSQQPVRPSSLYIQVGAFADHANAARAEARLIAMGQQAFSVPYTHNGQQLYRVRVGPITTVDQADVVLNRVSSNGFSAARIIVEQ